MAEACFTVVICAYADDRLDDLLAAVESVRGQTTAPLEIIVVVDHNPRLQAAVSARLPGVAVVANRQARGLSGARNSGVAAATAPLIAFLDDDAVAAPDWLAELRVGFDDPAVVGVGGAIEPSWAGGRPAWFPDEFNWVVGCSYRGMPTRPALVRNLIGANMAFRREAFAAVGGFRGDMGRVGTRPVGCEETEFCIRLRQRWPDAVLLYRPQATVRHRVPANRAGWGYFASRCYAEGLSKAQVADLVGARDGLATERSYTLRTLPSGAGRGLADALHGDWSGLGRAGAIVAGLAMTTAGYARGVAAARRAAPRPAARPAD
jgi:glycosyltransferase involved in cell wall biosynthesis